MEYFLGGLTIILFLILLLNVLYMLKIRRRYIKYRGKEYIDDKLEEVRQGGSTITAILVVVSLVAVSALSMDFKVDLKIFKFAIDFNGCLYAVILFSFIYTWVEYLIRLKKMIKDEDRELKRNGHYYDRKNKF